MKTPLFKERLANSLMLYTIIHSILFIAKLFAIGVLIFLVKSGYIPVWFIIGSFLFYFIFDSGSK